MGNRNQLSSRLSLFVFWERTEQTSFNKLLKLVLHEAISCKQAQSKMNLQLVNVTT